MNKTFIICCTEQTAEELRERGIESTEGLVVINDDDDLAKQIIRTPGPCVVFLEDIHTEAKVGDSKHIASIVERIMKIKTSASILMLDNIKKVFNPNLFKGCVSIDGLLTIISK